MNKIKAGDQCGKVVSNPWESREDRTEISQYRDGSQGLKTLAAAGSCG